MAGLLIEPTLDQKLVYEFIEFRFLVMTANR